MNFRQHQGRAHDLRSATHQLWNSDAFQEGIRNPWSVWRIVKGRPQDLVGAVESIEEAKRMAERDLAAHRETWTGAA